MDSADKKLITYSIPEKVALLHLNNAKKRGISRSELDRQYLLKEAAKRISKEKNSISKKKSPSDSVS